MGRTRIRSTIIRLGVPVATIGLVGNACFFHALFACIGFGEFPVQGILVTIGGSLAIIHVLSMVVSFAHAAGIIWEHGATAYFTHIYGASAGSRPMILWALAALGVVCGPVYTAYALLAPCVRSLSARDAEKDGTPIGPVIPEESPHPP